MKLIGFVCALALAGAVGGCGDDEGNGNGNGGTAGTGATAGSGGSGGSGGAGVMDQCIGAEDDAVYAEVTFTTADDPPVELTGAEAVSQIASDCVFGTNPNLTSDGCGTEATTALGNQTPENIAALAACVVQCTADQPVALTAGCLSCYGDSVVCGAVNCAPDCGPGAGGPQAPGCISCRCGQSGVQNPDMINCFGIFDGCSGLPRVPDPCAG